MRNIERETESYGEPEIDLKPMVNSRATEDARKQLLELQLRMAACSINHEYARKEFDDVRNNLRNDERKQELLDYMHECRCQYFDARSELVAYDPYALAEFEADLMRQKQVTFAEAGFQA